MTDQEQLDSWANNTSIKLAVNGYTFTSSSGEVTVAPVAADYMTYAGLMDLDDVIKDMSSTFPFLHTIQSPRQGTNHAWYRNVNGSERMYLIADDTQKYYVWHFLGNPDDGMAGARASSMPAPNPPHGNSVENMITNYIFGHPDNVVNNAALITATLTTD